jgi:hypothetical protein
VLGNLPDGVTTADISSFLTESLNVEHLGDIEFTSTRPACARVRVSHEDGLALKRMQPIEHRIRNTLVSVVH